MAFKTVLYMFKRGGVLHRYNGCCVVVYRYLWLYYVLVDGKLKKVDRGYLAGIGFCFDRIY